MKVIGFSGAHSTGKSTVINCIATSTNSLILSDTFQVSRTVQEELGLTLDEITSDIELMKPFQSKLLSVKAIHDLSLRDSINPGFICVDRTPADMYAYAKIWIENHPLGSLTKNQEWLEDYKVSCAAQMSIYSCIAYFPIDGIPFVYDPKRASLETRERHDKLCLEFLSINKSPVYTMSFGSSEQRTDDLCRHLLSGNL